MKFGSLYTVGGRSGVVGLFDGVGVADFGLFDGVGVTGFGRTGVTVFGGVRTGFAGDTAGGGIDKFDFLRFDSTSVFAPALLFAISTLLKHVVYLSVSLPPFRLTRVGFAASSSSSWKPSSK
jgi:hypothetical protein